MRLGNKVRHMSKIKFLQVVSTVVSDRLTFIYLFIHTSDHMSSKEHRPRGTSHRAIQSALSQLFYRVSDCQVTIIAISRNSSLSAYIILSTRHRRIVKRILNNGLKFRQHETAFENLRYLTTIHCLVPIQFPVPRITVPLDPGA